MTNHEIEQSIETDIDVATELKHRTNEGLNDLGWENEGGKTAKVIRAIHDACLVLGHKPMDSDHSFYSTGADHRVICYDCGYLYHYDSSD